MRPLELRLLGPFAASTGGRPLSGLTQKGQALLAYLAASGPAERERLAALLWDASDARARRNLRQELYRLRQRGLAPYLREQQGRIELQNLRSDYHRFWRHYHSGRPQAALALVRGSFLEGLHPEASGFEDWRYLENERLKEAVIALHLRLAEQLEAEDPEAAIGHLEAALAWDPLLELAYQRLFPLLAKTGRKSEAEARYRRLERMLQEELGIPPSPETERQFQAARKGEARRPEAAPAPPSLENPPLVEREAELAALERAPEPLRWIHGEEGVGKTRLAQAYLGPRALWIRFYPSLSELPYGALAEALRPHQKKLRTLPEEIRSELARILPELGPASPHPITEPEARVRFFEALVAGLKAVAPGGVLDALENADAAFLEFLPYLARRSAALGLTWVVTARTPPPAELVAEGLVAALPLRPLSEAGVHALIQALSGSPGGRRFAARLHRATGGNPRFLTETIKDLFQSGELRLSAGGWSTPYDRTPDYLELRLPRSVREALLRRWQELGPESQRVVRFLLFAKGPATPELAARALGLGEEAAAAALFEGERAGLLYRVAQGYLPRYPELRETVPQPLAKTVHRRWAAALAELGGHPLLIAEHLAEGGRAELAQAAYLEAARKARTGPHPATAVVLYRRAERGPGLSEAERYRVRLERLELETELGRDTLDNLLELGPPPRPDPGLEARWHLAAAEAALKKGRFETAREHAEAAWGLSAGDAATARARFLLAWVEYRAGDPWRQREHLEAALEAFTRAGDHRQSARVRRNLAALAFRLGDHETGEREQRRVLETLSQHPDPVTYRRVWADRLTGRWLHRDYHAALEGAQRLLAEARRAADLPAQMDALELIGLAEWKLGRYRESLFAFDQGKTLAQAVGTPRENALFASERALPLIEMGRFQEAEAALEEALAGMRALGDQAKIGHVYTAFGELRYRQGRPEEAIPWLERAIRHWEERGEGGHAARAHALMALALEATDPKAARRHAETARRHADGWRTGVPERLLVYAVYARFHPAAGEEARALLEAEAARIPPELRAGHRKTFAARLVTDR